MPAKTLPLADNPPPCDGLDIGAFARVFHNTTTSYKFFWALALMRAVKKPGAQPAKVSFKKMTAGMLDAARRIVYVFRLRLAKDDKLAEWFHHLEMLPHWDAKTLTNPKGIYFAPKAQHIPDTVVDDLTAFVRHLFMSPFFNVPPGIVGPAKFKTIREMAKAASTGESPPPYHFTDGNDAIIIHPKWRAYFAANYEIVNAWILWHLARHLQGLNPNVPAITVKLDEDSKPKIQQQKAFWRLAMTVSAGSHACIYTGEIIDARNFALDHYVPWSFIAHDNMWNLVPVSNAGNAAKSNNLPCGSEYFDEFVDMQHRAIKTLHALPNNKKWKPLFESYDTDLNLDVIGQTITRDDLADALTATITPLLAIAQNRKFKPDWVFGKRGD